MIPSSKKLTLHLEYPIGSTVYLRLRDERLPGMIVGVAAWPTGIVYHVGWGDQTESRHYEMELTAEYRATFEVDD